MKQILCILLLPLFIFSACEQNGNASNNPDTISIATFNISWLGDGIDDEIPRTDADYKRIAYIISQLNPDIMGLQEIENESAIKKLLKFLPGYDFYIGTKGGNQNPSLIYKKDIKVSEEYEYTPLIVEPNKTRPGLIAKVRKGNFDFIMLVVHLKSTSRYDSTAELEQNSRELRMKQSDIISNWVDSVLSLKSEKDIIILGDFNDYPNRVTNPTLNSIAENPHLRFITQDLKSCKFPILNGIDHIIASVNAGKRYIPGSLRLYDFYSSISESEIEKISDHCPVLVQFEVKSKDDD
ncbi:MAG: endonuclease/exonuclease/phosphatase family protein [Ignavibacteriae bacterium]|nr:endonuclease/exonuclease/phosphatase family protein [Ignavibacteriota bacterium]